MNFRLFNKFIVIWFTFSSVASNFEFFHFHTFYRIISNNIQYNVIKLHSHCIPPYQCLVDEFVFSFKNNFIEKEKVFCFNIRKVSNIIISLFLPISNFHFKLQTRSPPIF